MTRAFDRYKLQCHKASQKFFTMENQKFLKILKMSHGYPQIVPKPCQNVRSQPLDEIFNEYLMNGETDSEDDSYHKFWDEI